MNNETEVQTGYEDFLTIKGPFLFAAGIANGTTIATTPNMTVCQNGFYYFYNGFGETYD